MEPLDATEAQPLLLTIPQVAHRLALSRASIYKLISTHELPVMHFGRAIRISATSLEKWVQGREEQEQAAS